MTFLLDNIEAIQQEIIDPTDENVQAVNTIIQQLVEKKITQNAAQDLLKPYVKRPDFLSTFYNPYMGQSMFMNGAQKMVSTRSKSIPWSSEEDQKLLNAVEEHGSSNWTAVAAYVGNGRTKAQCSQRYNRVINPNILKSNWTKEEEEKLMQVVAQVGNKAWTRVAANFGNRSDVQCRFKYNYLIKHRDQGNM